MARLQNVTVNGLISEIGALYKAAETNLVIPAFDRTEQLEEMEVILADIFEAGTEVNDKLMMATLFVAICRFMANNADDNNLLSQLDGAIDWMIIRRSEPVPLEPVTTGPAIDPNDLEAIEDFERQNPGVIIDQSRFIVSADELPSAPPPVKVTQTVRAPKPKPPGPRPPPQETSSHPIVDRNLERMKGNT